MRVQGMSSHRRPIPGCDSTLESSAVRSAEGHTRNQTEHGPDDCKECSEAMGERVQWPCPTVSRYG